MLQALRDRLTGKSGPKRKRRSPKWRKVRAEHLHNNPRCACCGGTKKLEVHHLVPFHEAPELELQPTNLLTLCESKRYGINCHQLVGHLGNYRRVNRNCRKDAAVWNRKLKPKRKKKRKPRKARR